MTHTRSVRAGIIVIAVFGLGCGDPRITDPPSLTPASTPNAALLPLDVFGIGTPVPPGGRACSAAEYRQFDFWIGKWDVYNPAGLLAGTNVVERDLDACVVEENWTDRFGGRGRSLNTYDAATRTWHQFWVFAGGGVFTPILMEGGLAGGSMRMAGTKTSATGVFIPLAGRVVFAITDQITWTLLSSGSVRQFGEIAFDSDPLTTAFDLRYDPVAQVTPIAETPRLTCVFRAGNNQFNFMLGQWDVHLGEGVGAQGGATFTKDLGGCLLEERFFGRGGYAGWSFNSYSVFTDKWHRTYVDNAGHRLTLIGSVVNGMMVLTGVWPSAAGRNVEVRVSWIPVTPNEVRQRWEFSVDGGARWNLERELVYTRHQ